MSRYIDEDLVNFKLKQICDKSNTSYGIQFGGRAKDFAQLTDDIPTADVAEAKSEAIKEFAERICRDRVVNDPVVIAIKTELKLMEEKENEK